MTPQCDAAASGSPFDRFSDAEKDARWVRCVAHIRKNATGEVRRYETDEILQDGETHPSVFNWEENNFSCDCNRELLFERSAGNEIETEECSDGRFSVNLENPVTGEIYYREFEPNTERSNDGGPLHLDAPSTSSPPELGAAPGSPQFTERFRGSGRRFEWRVFGSERGQRYEVYAPGLVQVAECLTPEGAEMVCNALNALPENAQVELPPQSGSESTKGVTGG